MASIILKRKTFAGMNFVKSAANMAQRSGAKGMGNVMKSANAQIARYDTSAGKLKEGFANWKKSNNGGFRDYIKSGEGQKLWNANRSQAGAANESVGKALQKSGLVTGAQPTTITLANGTTKQISANQAAVNKAATNMVHTNNIKKTVGMGQGISNTWNSGAMGKAKVLGTGAALVGTGALAGSMMSGGKSEQRGYSEKSTFHFKRIRK